MGHFSTGIFSRRSHAQIYLYLVQYDLKIKFSTILLQKSDKHRLETEKLIFDKFEIEPTVNTHDE